MAESNRFASIFPAAVTGSAQGSGLFAGQTVFSWAEQIIDPQTGVLEQAVPGRTGTATVAPAFELNNQTPQSFPFFTWMRLRGLYGGMPVYEFKLGGQAATPTSRTLTCVTNVCPIFSTSLKDGEGNYVMIGISVEFTTFVAS